MPNSIVFNGTDDFVELPASACDGKWHSVAVLFNGCTTKVYIDGKRRYPQKPRRKRLTKKLRLT